MTKQIITTDQVAQPTNPFSLGIKVNNLIYTSGQVGKDQTGKIVEGFQAQVEQAMENLKSILEAGGSSMENIVKVTIFVTDISKMSQLNEIYRRYFHGTFPTRSTVEVSNLGLSAEVEIEAVALIE